MTRALAWHRRLPVTGALAVLLAACDVLPDAMSGSGTLACGDTDRSLCRAVAELSIAQMNLTATGPITSVELSQIENCLEWGKANFRIEVGAAVDCWEVAVTGERSHGGGTVARFADGTLRPYWP
jgi:hypothetical protein